MKTSTRIIDYRLKGCMEGGFSKITSSGRSKRNIPLPAFQNELVRRINEYTYKPSTHYESGGCRLPIEMWITKKGRAVSAPEESGNRIRVWE